ncbi:MAG TPA: SGNH/GDSL hydrolase family protein [Capsulimonadaceae bacterium]|nr:SGNH/GDSL hydrolase family protein [Capsulimonadaceae bacterium]
MKLPQGTKLVMIGDSITDAGRLQPIGEGLFDALGKGYVSFFDALLGAVYPDRAIRVLNMGTSGNTVRELKARWQTDVIDLKPDWLSIMIGTNDVWRQFDLPKMAGAGVDLDAYEATYEELIAQTKPILKGLILATPFYIEPNRNDAMRRRMDEYGAVVKRLAHKYDAVFVDTQAAFDEILNHYYAATLAWDRVHPNQTGHMVLARAFLNVLDFKW